MAAKISAFWQNLFTGTDKSGEIKLEDIMSLSITLRHVHVNCEGLTVNIQVNLFSAISIEILIRRC